MGDEAGNSNYENLVTVERGSGALLSSSRPQVPREPPYLGSDASEDNNLARTGAAGEVLDEGRGGRLRTGSHTSTLQGQSNASTSQRKCSDLTSHYDAQSGRDPLPSILAHEQEQAGMSAPAPASLTMLRGTSPAPAGISNASGQQGQGQQQQHHAAGLMSTSRQVGSPTASSLQAQLQHQGNMVDVASMMQSAGLGGMQDTSFLAAYLANSLNMGGPGGQGPDPASLTSQGSALAGSSDARTTNLNLPGTDSTQQFMMGTARYGNTMQDGPYNVTAQQLAGLPGMAALNSNLPGAIRRGTGQQTTVYMTSVQQGSTNTNMLLQQQQQQQQHAFTSGGIYDSNSDMSGGMQSDERAYSLSMPNITTQGGQQNLQQGNIQSFSAAQAQQQVSQQQLMAALMANTGAGGGGNSEAMLLQQSDDGLQPSLGSSLQTSTTSASLYVKNLPPEADELFLYQKFAPHGAVLSCKIMADPVSGRCRGVGFVNFADHTCAVRALQHLHGSRIGEGRQMQVVLQAPRAMRAAVAAAHGPPTQVVSTGLQLSGGGGGMHMGSGGGQLQMQMPVGNMLQAIGSGSLTPGPSGSLMLNPGMSIPQQQGSSPGARGILLGVPMQLQMQQGGGAIQLQLQQGPGPGGPLLTNRGMVNLSGMGMAMQQPGMTVQLVQGGGIMGQGGMASQGSSAGLGYPQGPGMGGSLMTRMRGQGGSTGMQ